MSQTGVQERKKFVTNCVSWKINAFLFYLLDIFMWKRYLLESIHCKLLIKHKETER